MKKLTIVCLSILMVLNMMIVGYANQIEQIDVLKIGIRTDEGTLNPYTYQTEMGSYIFKFVFDSLFNRNVDLQPEPWLVKNYTLSDDGLVYVFELHDNVKFHDGQPLTAEDVKFTFEYLKQYVKGRFSGPSAAISDITILDEFTIEMTLSSPQPEFLQRPLAEMGILPKHIWENITDPDSSRETIGSGPYKLTEISDGEYYLFEAYEDYFKGKPIAKQIYMPIIRDASAMFTALQAGELDTTSVELPPETVEQFKNNPRLDVIEGPGFVTALLSLNTERYPFSNKTFRQALVYATNRQEIVDVVMLGTSTLGSLGFTHPSHESYNNQVNQMDFDIEKANALLDDLGFFDTNGNGIRETDTGEELSFVIFAHAGNPLRIRIAELTKEYYAQIGIELKVQVMDVSVIVENVWPNFEAINGRNYDMTTWGWGASTMGSVQRYIQNFHSDFTIGTSNIGGYQSEAMDEVLNQLLVETDPAEILDLVKEVQMILSEDVPHIMLYYPNLAYAYNPDIYDNWQFIQGAGIVNVLSVIDMSATSDPGDKEPTAPVEEQPAEDASNRNMIILGVMIVAALVYMLVSRKKTSKKQ